MRNFLLIFCLIALSDSLKGSPINDEVCENQLNSFSAALSKREFWAIQLVDTWGKFQSGYLQGNVMDIGDFDTCVNFRHDTQSHGIIQGQHCRVVFNATANSTFEGDNERFDLREFANFLRLTGFNLINGFCLPASCSPTKVSDFLNLEFLNKNDLEALGAQCTTNDPIEMQPIDIAATIIFGLFLLALIGSTLHDLYMRKSNKTPHKFWSSHSIYTNGMKLFDMTKIKSPSAINCMNGLRVLSIFWIIFGHRINNQIWFANITELLDLLGRPKGIVIMTYDIAVDTFLVIGAVLMTWGTLRDCEKGQLSIGRMIWRRYLRYTPALAALILFIMSVAKFFMNGPFPDDSLAKNCEENWWLALLHVQNFISYEKMCLNHLWYICIDFQLFVISPFIIYTIHSFGKKFLALPLLLLTATIAYLISITAVLGITMPYPFATQEFLDWIYFPTQSRAGPWFTGIVLGYFMYHNRGKTFRINSLLNSILWIGALSLQLLILFGIFFFNNTGGIAQAWHSLFIAFYRNLWALAICWTIFACQHLKTGGIIRWFLSLPQWQPIGRMGLSMYLVSAIYQYIQSTNQRVPLYMNFWQFIPLYLSDLVVSVFLATISYLAFEAPPLIMEDYLHKKWKNRGSAKKNETESEP